MKSALIVFAKLPVSGQVKTRLLPRLSEEGAARLYAALIQDTAALAQRAGVDTRWYVTPQKEGFVLPVGAGTLHVQRGSGLGERLHAAFEETSRAGYDRIIVIGTDSPTLPLEGLLESFEAISEPGSAVVGPADDGGYYLLGLHDVSSEFFTEVTYSNPDVFRSTWEKLEAIQGCLPHRLPVWYDVDTPADLDRMVAELSVDPSQAPATWDALVRLGQVTLPEPQ